jgi:hypothetical protein
MANATPRDTRAGFDIYKSAGGAIDLDDLNARLSDAGYGPVAERSLRHYRKLLDAGYTRYISINRFDVARAATPYENASANGRYDYRQADLGVNVIFAKSSSLFEASGRATEVGEVGAMLRFVDTEVVKGLRKVKPQPGEMVTLRYLETGRSMSGRVIEVDLTSERALVEIEYSRLLSIADIGIGEPLPVGDARFVIRGPDDEVQTLDVVGRRLFLFFEALEGVRALSNAASAQQVVPTYAPPPVLKRLSVASPADLLLELAPQVTALMPWALIGMVLRVAWAIPAKRKEWLEGSGQALQNKVLALELQIKELEVEAKQEEAALRSEMVDRLRATFPHAQITDDAAKRTIDDFILPPLRSLGRSGVDSLHPQEPATSEPTPPAEGSPDDPG